MTSHHQQAEYFCRAVLSTGTRKRKNKRLILTDNERRLFDTEELLSSDLLTIANHCQRCVDSTHQRLKPSSSSLIHRFCRRGMYPDTLIERYPTTDEQVPWSFVWKSYQPPYYTAISVPNEETDPDSIQTETFRWNAIDPKSGIDRRTANPAGHYLVDSNGFPLNPLGRTGLAGRGILRRWAVNYQVHLVIMISTRMKQSDKEVFSYLVEKPLDSPVCRVPSTWTTGATMDAIKHSLRIYLTNIYQFWNKQQLEDSTVLNAILDHLTFVSTAYIDDVRNTDNAWLETSVCCFVQSHFHQRISSNKEFDLQKLFPDRTNGEKLDYYWQKIDSKTSLLDSERDLIKLIAHRYRAYW